jgi:hypothetical protein
MDTPIPADREQLAHVLGIIRYHYKGPIQMVSVMDGGNFVTMRHFLASEPIAEKLLVSRLLHFKYTPATPAELTQRQLTTGNGVITEVIGYRVWRAGRMSLSCVGSTTPSRPGLRAQA